MRSCREPNASLLTRSSGYDCPFAVLLEVFRRPEESFVQVRDRLHTEVESSEGYNPTGNIFESNIHCNSRGEKRVCCRTSWENGIAVKDRIRNDNDRVV